MSDVPTRAVGPDSTQRGPSPVYFGAGAAADVELSELSELALHLRTAPDLSRNRSFVIERAVAEFNRQAATSPELTPTDFCRRYAEFGSSVQSSICRQLEVDGFVNRYSWLKEHISSIDWPTAGERLASFRVMEEIGRGASSRVYLCSQPELGDRQVIIKIGSSVLLEANSLGRLRHANIIPIYSAELDAPNRRMLICMPFLGRSTLHDLLDLRNEEAGALSGKTVLRAACAWRQPCDCVAESALRDGYPTRCSFDEGVAYIGACLAGALAHAHSQGILHGDIKPSNILLAQNGAPYLMDFDLSGNAALAVPARGGTLPYMPPEQLRKVILENPHAAEYDFRSDVFSLGVVLYELLSGQAPFGGTEATSESASLAAGMLDRQCLGCPPLRRQNGALPASLAATIEKCLSFQPGDRIQSAAELQRLLWAELGTWGNVRRQVMRHPWAAAAAAGCLTAGIAAASAHVLMAPPEHVQLFREAMRLQASGNVQYAEELLARSVTMEPAYRDARFHYATSLLNRGETAMARESFFALTESASNGRDASYLAYCFCLDGKFAAAIPWYERALELGYDSADLRNNLAVAYEGGGRSLDTAARLERVGLHLDAALRQSPASPTVRINKIMHEVVKAREQETSLSPQTLALCEEMTTQFPDCGVLHEYAARAAAYSGRPGDLVSGLHWLERARNFGYPRSVDELRSNKDWKPYHKMTQFADIVDAAQESSGKPRSGVAISKLAPPPLVQ